jgi:hypothetical protein
MKMELLRKNLALQVATITVTHQLFQFVAWGNANAIVSANGLQDNLWKMLSFPIFWILPTNIITVNFELLFLVNSLVWGGAWITAIRGALFLYHRKPIL